jgi:hypothetical protein
VQSRLAQLQIEPDSKRGPDVVHNITLPVQWLGRGAVIECELPRRLRCATCEGGGCDRCGRSGVVTLWSEGEPARSVVVHLTHTAPRALLRILGEGGADPDPELARGCLMLHICPGELSPGVRLLELPKGQHVWLVLVGTVLVALVLAVVFVLAR